MCKVINVQSFRKHTLHKRSIFHVRGRKVSEQKIKRFVQRRGLIQEADPNWTSLPDHIRCSTPPETDENPSVTPEFPSPSRSVDHVQLPSLLSPFLPDWGLSKGTVDSNILHGPLHIPTSVVRNGHRSEGRDEVGSGEKQGKPKGDGRRPIEEHPGRVGGLEHNHAYNDTRLKQQMANDKYSHTELELGAIWVSGSYARSVRFRRDLDRRLGESW